MVMVGLWCQTYKVTRGLPRLVALPEVHVEGEVHELLTDLTGEDTLEASVDCTKNCCYFL